MTHRTHKLANLAFIVVSIAWGTTYAAIHIAVETISPAALAAVRFTIAGLILMLALRAGGIPFPERRDWPRLILTGALLLAGANTLVATGSQYLPSVLVALMVNTGPFMYVGMQAGFGERIPRGAWTGLLIGLAGVVVLVSPELLALFSGGQIQADATFWRAIGIVALAPVFWSAGCLYAARRPPHCHHLMAAGAQSLAGGLVAFVISLPLGAWSPMPHPDLRGWLAVAWLVVVGSWLGYVAYMYCVAHLSAPRVGSITYLNDAVAIVLGWLVLGEVLTWPLLAGGALLLLGVYVVRRAEARLRHQQADTAAADAATEHA